MHPMNRWQLDTQVLSVDCLYLYPPVEASETDEGGATLGVNTLKKKGSHQGLSHLYSTGRVSKTPSFPRKAQISKLEKETESFPASMSTGIQHLPDELLVKIFRSPFEDLENDLRWDAERCDKILEAHENLRKRIARVNRRFSILAKQLPAVWSPQDQENAGRGATPCKYSRTVRGSTLGVVTSKGVDACAEAATKTTGTAHATYYVPRPWRSFTAPSGSSSNLLSEGLFAQEDCSKPLFKLLKDASIFSSTGGFELEGLTGLRTLRVKGFNPSMLRGVMPQLTSLCIATRLCSHADINKLLVVLSAGLALTNLVLSIDYCTLQYNADDSRLIKGGTYLPALQSLTISTVDFVETKWYLEKVPEELFPTVALLRCFSLPKLDILELDFDRHVRSRMGFMTRRIIGCDFIEKSLPPSSAYPNLRQLILSESLVKSSSLVDQLIPPFLRRFPQIQELHATLESLPTDDDDDDTTFAPLAKLRKIRLHSSGLVLNEYRTFMLGLFGQEEVNVEHLTIVDKEKFKEEGPNFQFLKTSPNYWTNCLRMGLPKSKHVEFL